MALAALAFAVSAWIQSRLDAGDAPCIAWQLPAYLLLTSAEVMISITALEFAYTQAPLSMKSTVMAFYTASVALGNLLTSGVNFLLLAEGPGKLAGANYFWFFTGLMGATTILFALYSRYYRDATYLHPNGGPPTDRR